MPSDPILAYLEKHNISGMLNAIVNELVAATPTLEGIEAIAVRVRDGDGELLAEHAPELTAEHREVLLVTVGRRWTRLEERLPIVGQLKDVVARVRLRDHREHLAVLVEAVRHEGHLNREELGAWLGQLADAGDE